MADALLRRENLEVASANFLIGYEFAPTRSSISVVREPVAYFEKHSVAPPMRNYYDGLSLGDCH